jgi:hypothetical protein
MDMKGGKKGRKIKKEKKIRNMKDNVEENERRREERRKIRYYYSSLVFDFSLHGHPCTATHEKHRSNKTLSRAENNAVQ